MNFIQSGDTAANVETKVNPGPQNVSPGHADGTWEKIRSATDNLSMIPASRLGQIQSASRLLGKTVKNSQDEKLGKVENLLLDLFSGRVMAVVLSSGGFLGVGDDLSAIPSSLFRPGGDRDPLVLDVTKDTLAAAPHFKPNQWPDFAQPANIEGVYRSYRIEPYFDSGRGSGADNTGINDRDREGRTLTPLDQGNTQGDLDLTTRIRKDIIARKDLSLNAQNVKIITISGRVMLRGPVDITGEKRLVGEIASNIAKAENVDNQLEVR